MMRYEKRYRFKIHRFQWKEILLRKPAAPGCFHTIGILAGWSSRPIGRFDFLNVFLYTFSRNQPADQLYSQPGKKMEAGKIPELNRRF